MKSSRRIAPGQTIGILGGGQLGRMLAISARQHGYRVVVMSADLDSPAGQVADDVVIAPYADTSAVARFAAKADVVTFEFENVPAAAAEVAAERALVRPDPSFLALAQNRIREKTEVQRAGFPVTPFRPIRRSTEIADALAALGSRTVLKTAQSGYDGRGQRRVSDVEGGIRAFTEFGLVECVLEAYIPFEKELSVILARGIDGAIVDYGVFENDHVDHILDSSVSPARVPERVQALARELARGVAQQLEVVGLFCVELFLTTDGELLFNELAPRPHNSGHLTLEAHVTSQFEQQLRAICGQSLGSVERRASAAAMVNLLGDLWTYDLDGVVIREPSWSTMLGHRGCHLYLYGKRAPRLGRKMGHITTLADNPQSALARSLAARSALLASA